MNKSKEKRIPTILSLKMIFEGTAEYTGKAFFRQLVKQLAEVLNVHGVWVTEYKEKEYRLNALAFWLDGAFVEKYEYDIEGTPCEPVLKSTGLCHIPDKVIQLYPKDPDLPPLGAVSYMGIVLKDENGKVLGHLALLDNKPMQEIPEVFTIFRLFASRAGAEMRRMQYERRLLENERMINRLLNGTMDAIIELDGDLHITQANTAAHNTFRVQENALLGRPIREFLQAGSFRKLQDTIPFLEQGDRSDNSLWVQGYLYCLNANGETFPADATLSAYPYEGKTFYALYIRDVNDRLHKEEEIKRLTVETTLLREKVNADQISDIIGASEPVKQLMTQIGQVAPTDSTVLILGETGTGKELVARAIHQNSSRKEQAFITLNCAALPADLIESELFGHVKGAFTGAIAAREGRFKLADGGTIFLDEIGELPLPLQAKLLRVIQEGELEPVGSSITKKVNVRIIAATHRDLKKEADAGRFRGDLYYRLNVFPIPVPPLRVRGNDIIILAEAFLDKYAGRHGRKVQPLSESDKQKLLQYRWPGNVRELQNIMERAVITSQSGELQLALSSSEGAVPVTNPLTESKVLTHEELQHLERKNLVLALKMAKGKVFGDGGAAQLVGIPPTTFSSKLKKHGIDPRS